MIRYSLVCENGHDFEGWFKDSSEYDRQLKKKRLECPSCGSPKVQKALMAPAVSSKSPIVAEMPVVEPGNKLPVATPDPRRAALIEAMRELRRVVTENAEYVGERFPEEARKIHYKEAEARGIYGEASPDEAKGLAEEGIEFHSLPILPEDRN